MRGKRAKQYRKLMQQYGLTFGFREPFQVLIDSEMIQDAERFKMDLVASLERTLSGKVKLMITQCSIRHLYALTSPTTPQPLKETFIATAKTMERRRCNHHELSEPLSTFECLSSVIDPKNSGTNKNRYVIASQEEEVRRYCRGLKGVPLVYVKRSVMVMEPMSDGSVGVRESTEKEKFRQGIRGRVAGLGKRKRDDEEGDKNGGGVNRGEDGVAASGGVKDVKKKRTRGPKGPNPLSVKKPKSEVKATKVNEAKVDIEGQRARRPDSSDIAEAGGGHVTDAANGGEADDSHPSKRKKKRRRQKPKRNGALAAAEDGEGGEKADMAREDIGEIPST